MKSKPSSPAGSRAASGKSVAPKTIEMVALEAGVSPSTVSRILNGTAVVSEAKKKAVQDAVAKLGFVPNPMARGLAGGRTFSVGVITQAIDSPFYGSALRGIEDEMDPAGYSPLFVSGHWNAEKEARCIDILRSRRVDGIIVLTGRLTDTALRKCAQNVRITEHEGARCYFSSIPPEVIYHQRRSAFRAPLTQGELIKIELAGDKLRTAIAGQLLDISATGCKLRFPGNISSSLQAGQVYERFTARFPFGPMTTAIEVRHVQYEEKLDTTFAGVRFHRMNGLEQRQVERFVYQLQREARRFESDGLF